MSKFFNTMIEILYDTGRALKRTIGISSRVIAKTAHLLLPFVMLYIGQYIALDRGKITLGSEIFIPLVVGIFVYMVKAYSNKVGKGISIPLPPKGKRFTEVSDDGEVNVQNSRIQELILYVAEVEDWFSRKGLR